MSAKKRVFTDDQIKNIIDLYNNNESIKNIAVSYSCGYDTIKNILLESNTPIRSKEANLKLMVEKMESTKLKKYGYSGFDLEKVKQTKLERYGDENYKNKDKAKRTKLEKYGDENYHNIEKAKQTKLEKYGDENYNNRDKCRETKFERYGDENYSNLEKVKKTKLEKYGSENYTNIAKSHKTKLERYGDENYNNRDKAKQTCFNLYGDENYSNIEKSKRTKLEKYGDENYNNLEQIQQTKLERYGYSGWNINKAKQTELKKYGSINIFQVQEFKDKAKKTKFNKYGDENYTNPEKRKQTNLEKYGVPYYCMTDNCRSASSNDSKPNKDFAELLEQNNIEYQREFHLGNYSYDFKVDNRLIEIDPSATHNSTWDPFGKEPKDKLYHQNKSKYAEEKGYQCIHIWDWDNLNGIIQLLKPRCSIYARKCKIKIVNKEEAKNFINNYHIQGYAKDDIRIGLYYNNELVSIMTFDKPRYNKKFQYELVRYCSSYNITGGAEKLFNYFIKVYHPESIISYCDKSKFNGNTYLKLGFVEDKKCNPSKHWYNIKTGRHITDNLLRQRGFDQLFNENYGKGTSNDDLMKQYGFVEIYDCGQQTYKKQFS